MKLLRFTILLLLLLSAVMARGQKEKQRQKQDMANELYSQSMYHSALPIFEQLFYAQKIKGKYAYKVAECYRRLNLTADALRWYDSAMVYKATDADLYLHYGESLLCEGHYDQANKLLREYIDKNPDNEYAKLKLESCQFAKNYKNSNPVQVEQVKELNTVGYEFGIAEFQGRLIYSYGELSTKRKSTSRIAAEYTQLYIVDSVGATPKAMFGLHERYASEGGFTFDPIMQVGYTTRSSDLPPYTQVVGYSYSQKYDTWSLPNRRVEAKLFKVEGRVTGHPFITEDGQRMYFAGILPKGHGGTDIWYVNRQPDSSWSRPINAGPSVNTAGSEAFPTYYDNVLYFSSSGHLGFGGFDLFASVLDVSGTHFGKAQNLGRNINSGKDDMSLLMSKKLGAHYFVSDAAGGTYDDIYTFTKFTLSYCAQVMGRVVDVEQRPIAGVVVRVVSQGEDAYNVLTDKEGNFLVNLTPGQQTAFEAAKLPYAPAAQLLNVPQQEDLISMSNMPLVHMELQTLPPHGYVRNAKNNLPIAGAKVQVVQNGVTVASLVTDSAGAYVLMADKPQDVMVIATHGSYISAGRELTLEQLRDVDLRDSSNYLSLLDIALQSAAESPSAHSTLVATVAPPIDTTHELRNVYYGFDKSSICPESMGDLNKLVAFLKSNPHSTLFVASHTDTYGSDKYNLALSKQRANYVVNYLKSKGVSGKRISYKGYGESKPYIEQAQSEEAHWLNRRTEFIIVDGNGRVRVKSIPYSEKDFAGFCRDAVGKAKQGPKHILQVCVVSVNQKIDKDYVQNVEKLVGKPLRWLRDGDQIKYYFEFSSGRELLEADKKMKGKGFDTYQRRTF